MYDINFSDLKNLYNKHIDILLDSSGLTTKCLLNYGVSDRKVCDNCIYDPSLKKSANKYKAGGPIPFNLGQICPYCNGVGYYGEETQDIVYMAVIADNKKWINSPINIAITDNIIQTICSKNYLGSIKRCKDMTVVISETIENKKYSLYNDPTPAGLGDSNYIITFWKNV